jgi:hypothetical protein
VLLVASIKFGDSKKNCSHVGLLWKKIYAWLGKRCNNQNTRCLHFLHFGSTLKAKKGMKFRDFIWLATTWCIWQMRNNAIFRGEEADFQGLFDRIKSISWHWFLGKAGHQCHFIFSD